MTRRRLALGTTSAALFLLMACGSSREDVDGAGSGSEGSNSNSSGGNDAGASSSGGKDAGASSSSGGKDAGASSSSGGNDAGASSSSGGNDAATTATCTDATMNQDETDVDCGGSTCTKCADTKGCNVAADCTSGLCDSTTKKCAAMPVFMSIVPNAGPTTGGTFVTITGQNFATTGSVDVTIGGAAATGVTATATSITCFTGANLGRPGLADVVITNPNTGTVTGKDKFTYFDTTSTTVPVAYGALKPMNPRLADLNGDSKLDLLVPQDQSGNIAVRLGNGDGTFGGQILASNGGASIYSVVVGDLNGDNKQDLVTSDGNSGVRIVLGNGDGTFQPGTLLSVGGLSYITALADLNGDNKLDLVVVASDTSGARVFLGKGDGTFHAAIQTTVGPSGFWPTLRDVNGDGKLDLIVARRFTGPRTDVGLGNGDGTFQAPITLLHPAGANADAWFADAADLNGDGKPDIILGSNRGQGGIAVAMGNGDGTFKAPTLVQSGFNTPGVYAGDLDGDGSADLVGSNYDNGEVKFYRGKGDGTFFAPQLLTTFSWDIRGFTWADLNKDGRMDFVGAAYNTSRVFVTLGSTP